ncbi:hypothetical protein MKW94_021963 [Papaver nudicaule]|uniref:Transposase n=1 Tax=Papaver nudicaule TaxID=74823 RepID=A0AA41VNA3_PAPNU|nr:hypothetical protein [Papaver nudicaule]MCL7044213.1 hypothetical protein [Papaver nudicaule]
MAPGGPRLSRTSHAATDQLSRTDLPKIHKGRGDAINAKLNDHIRVHKTKPTINIPPGYTGPVGEWSSEFHTEIGIIIKKFAPLSTCPNWKSLNKSDIRKFHDLILEKFTIDLHVTRIQKAVNSMLSSEFRTFTSTLSNHYKKYEKDGTSREHPHHQVNQEDWESLCTWFESDKFKNLSTQGVKSREANKTKHCTGSKSFARYRYEMRDPETGEEIGQIKFYELSYCKKGVWKSPKAEENYGKMLELQAAPTPEGSVPLTEAQICEKVLGVRSGYIKGLGHGYEKPTSSSIEYNAELVEATRRADEAEKRNKELEQRVEEQQKTIDGLAADTMDIRGILRELQESRQGTN